MNWNIFGVLCLDGWLYFMMIYLFQLKEYFRNKDSGILDIEIVSVRYLMFYYMDG